jgi:site-specific DNA recombinase
MLVCRDCGYALYRTSTRTSARKLHYYRCLGSDAYRHLRGALCASRPVRADYLDEFVWREIIRLLEEPALVQAEIDRRLAAAQTADPLRQREQSLRNQQLRLRNVIERLLTAYQEELLSLEQLRQRMPALRKQQQAVDAELQSLALAAADHSRYLRLTETLADFCTKLHARADALDVTEKQKIARLLVHEILVSKDTIVIRHSIPLLEPDPDRDGSSTGPATTSTTRSAAVKAAGYLLRSGSNHPALRSAGFWVFNRPVFHHTRVQPLADESQQHSITYPLAHDISQLTMVQGPERTLDTLPTVTSTAIPSRCGLSGRATHWRAKPWRCWAGAIGKASYICCWCYPMAVAHGYPLAGLI